MPDETQSVSSLIIERLRSKDLNIDKLAQLTGVSERYVALIIEEDLDKLPASPYIRGYLFRIAAVLDLDGNELWEKYTQRGGDLHKSGTSDKLPSNRFATKGSAKKIILAVIILIPITTFIFLKFFYLTKPRINFENLEKDITITSDQIFIIKGNIDPIYKLSINDEEIILDKNGSFQKKLSLETGFNNVVFKTKKILGKEHIISKQIFRQGEEEGLINNKSLNPKAPNIPENPPPLPTPSPADITTTTPLL